MNSFYPNCDFVGATGINSTYDYIDRTYISSNVGNMIYITSNVVGDISQYTTSNNVRWIASNCDFATKFDVSTLKDFRSDNPYNIMYADANNNNIIRQVLPTSETFFRATPTGVFTNYETKIDTDGKLNVYHSLDITLPTRPAGWWKIHDELVSMQQNDIGLRVDITALQASDIITNGNLSTTTATANTALATAIASGTTATNALTLAGQKNNIITWNNPFNYSSDTLSLKIDSSLALDGSGNLKVVPLTYTSPLNRTGNNLSIDNIEAYFQTYQFIENGITVSPTLYSGYDYQYEFTQNGSVSFNGNTTITKIDKDGSTILSTTTPTYLANTTYPITFSSRTYYISSTTKVSGGSAYRGSPTITFSSGSATAYALLTPVSMYFVFVMTAPTYSALPTSVSISGGGATTNATANFGYTTLGGGGGYLIDTITLTGYGAGYTRTDNITITLNGGTIKAGSDTFTWRVVLNTTSIASLVITSGGSYTTAPTITITPNIDGGSGANFTAVLTGNSATTSTIIRFTKNNYQIYKALLDSATSPSFTWKDDANTGMYNIGDGIIGFGINGVEKLRINSTGILGDGSQLTNIPYGSISGVPNLTTKQDTIVWSDPYSYNSTTKTLTLKYDSSLALASGTGNLKVNSCDWSIITSKPTIEILTFSSPMTKTGTAVSIDLSTYATTSALTTGLAAKESVLTFSSPLTRTTNTIGIDLSTYATTSALTTGLATKQPTITFSNPFNYSSGTLSLKLASSLGIDGSGNLYATSGSSAWTLNGTNLYYTGGNVGIGITNPSYPLTTLSTTTTSQIRILQDTTNNANYLSFGSGPNNTSTINAYVGIDGTGLYNISAGSLVLSSHSAALTTNHILFCINGAEKMRLTNAGNLEINSPNYVSPLLTLDAGVANATTQMPRAIGKPLLRLGKTSFSTTAGDYYGIGFGYAPNTTDYNACEIGTFITDKSGNEIGDIVFSTRATNTNVAATERLRIYGSGIIQPNITNNAKIAFTIDGSKLGASTIGTYGGAGDRIILWTGDASSYPYSIGMASATLWHGVPPSATHRFYVGGSDIFDINSSGANCNGNLVSYGTLTIWKSSTANPDSGHLYCYNPNNSGGQNATVCVRTAGNAAGNAFYSMDISGYYGYTMGMKSSSSALYFNNGWNMTGNDRMSLDSSGNLWTAGTITSSGRIYGYGDRSFFNQITSYQSSTGNTGGGYYNIFVNEWWYQGYTYGILIISCAPYYWCGRVYIPAGGGLAGVWTDSANGFSSLTNFWDATGGNYIRCGSVGGYGTMYYKFIA